MEPALGTGPRGYPHRRDAWSLDGGPERFPGPHAGGPPGGSPGDSGRARGEGDGQRVTFEFARLR